MTMTDRSTMLVDSEQHLESPETIGGLSRRTVLRTAAVAAGTLAGMSPALADTTQAPGFGAPLVELHVPAGVLTPEQKQAMIKGITDVVAGATNLPPDQANKLWVQIFETAESGWGAGGQVFTPRPR
jgi:phenylpyruvate tautomerase PptA (4-oxalocrotonate tautomerase family)